MQLAKAELCKPPIGERRTILLSTTLSRVIFGGNGAAVFGSLTYISRKLSYFRKMGMMHPEEKTSHPLQPQKSSDPSQHCFRKPWLREWIQPPKE